MSAFALLVARAQVVAFFVWLLYTGMLWRFAPWIPLRMMR